MTFASEIRIDLILERRKYN